MQNGYFILTWPACRVQPLHFQDVGIKNKYHICISAYERILIFSQKHWFVKSSLLACAYAISVVSETCQKILGAFTAIHRSQSAFLLIKLFATKPSKIQFMMLFFQTEFYILSVTYFAIYFTRI